VPLRRAADEGFNDQVSDAKFVDGGVRGDVRVAVPRELGVEARRRVPPSLIPGHLAKASRSELVASDC
jgi:hypothetical protein